MRVRILADRAAYDSAGAVVPMTAGTVVEVAEQPGEPFAFWARMLLAGEAEQVADPPASPPAPPEPVAPPMIEEAPKRRGRPPLPRDADGNPIRI